MNVPLIVLVGPRKFGKTAAILRLIDWLHGEDYQVTYRHVDGGVKHIKDFLEETNLKGNGSFEHRKAPKSTPTSDFIYIDVFKKAKAQCRILEAPGEAFLTMGNQMGEVQAKIERVWNESSHKLFVFLANITSEEDDIIDIRNSYDSMMVQYLRKFLNKRNGVLILPEWADEFPAAWFNLGEIRRETVWREFTEKYPSTSNYLSNHAIKKPLGFLPFSAGSFHSPKDGIVDNWVLSDSNYPKALWKQIEMFRYGGNGILNWLMQKLYA